VVQRSWAALQYAAEEMKGGREVCLAAFQQMGLKLTAVKQMGLALQQLSQEMKCDRELCTAAVAQAAAGLGRLAMES